mmetsp:Transcript_5153/g.12362  ORF Transcript_5153/g.12362 Transcript_5153/m.12362 type:complete len:466 (+) Transcript_5153:87-1484(+)
MASAERGPALALTPRGTSLKTAGLDVGQSTGVPTATTPYGPYSARYDPAPCVRPAGKSDGTGPLATQATHDVVVSVMDAEDPSELQKRHKRRTEPGEMSIHWGVKGAARPACIDGYGIRTRSMPGDTVAGTVKANQLMGIAEYLSSRGEAIYKSTRLEPLGKSYLRGFNLPAMEDPSFTGFGMGSSKLEGVKDVITPRESLKEPDSVRSMYKKTHAAFDPGEAYTREYAWPDSISGNPHFRFGSGAMSRAANGVKVALNMEGEVDLSFPVTSVINKGSEDYRQVSHEKLGKPRRLAQRPEGLTPDHSFGMKSGSDDIPAGALIQGFYSPDEQAPDQDIGRCTRPGRRNFHSKRWFGVPSIRYDIPAIPEQNRSLANCVNYGDELDARGLICPQGFAFRGIADEDFALRRPRDELREIYASAGYSLDDDTFDGIFSESVAAFGDDEPSASIEAFLHFLMEAGHGRK